MRISGFILLIDSYLLRLGLVSILNRIQGVRVLKEFDSGDPFLAYLMSHPVDYMIMSQSIFDSSPELFISKPELLEKTILIHDHGKKALSSGLSPHDVHTSIGLMEEKDSIVQKIQKLLDQGDANTQSMELSPRETTIVRLVSMGHTNRQIAEQLFLSAHTVMTHRKNISSKLGIKSVSGLTVYAIVNNIITIEEVSSLPAK